MVQQNGKKPVSNLSSALASIHIGQQNTQASAAANNNSNDFNDNATRYHNEQDSMHYDSHYQLPQSIDIPMRQQASDFINQMPVDRIAEYRKNPPTEGISLFSHRVSRPSSTSNIF